MKTAQGKTVSICDGDLPTENGPCANAEEEDVNEDTVHEVAAKVVENVVRLAAQATRGNSPQSSSVSLQHETAEKPQQHRRTSEESRGACLMRLPTIQIDTVPSMPPSPEWSPTSEEHSFQEEVLDEAQIEIQFGAPFAEETPDEIRKFAALYVEDLISKAMTIAEQKQVSEDTSKAQDVAAQVVDEVIAKATEAVNERLQRSPVVTISLETLEFPIKYSQAPEEMKEFAASYVKEIISKAISMAEEKFVSNVPFNFEDVNLMKSSGPWYIRAREALMRLLRTACFCTPRRNQS